MIDPFVAEFGNLSEFPQARYSEDAMIAACQPGVCLKPAIS